jgi:hypothetical protein
MNALSLDLDPRTVATYDFPEAAQYLHLPQSTVRAWVCGQDGFEPLIAPAGDRTPMLSFINLVEIHMLAAIRRVYNVKRGKPDFRPTFFPGACAKATTICKRRYVCARSWEPATA